MRVKELRQAVQRQIQLLAGADPGLEDWSRNVAAAALMTDPSKQASCALNFPVAQATMSRSWSFCGLRPENAACPGGL